MKTIWDWAEPSILLLLLAVQRIRNIAVINDVTKRKKCQPNLVSSWSSKLKKIKCVKQGWKFHYFHYELNCSNNWNLTYFILISKNWWQFVYCIVKSNLPPANYRDMASDANVEMHVVCRHQDWISLFLPRNIFWCLIIRL